MGNAAPAAHTSTLSPTLADTATTSLAAAEQVGNSLGAPGHQLVVHAQVAFLNGFGQALLAGVAALVLGAVFVALRAPGRAESKANASQATAELAPAPTI